MTNLQTNGKHISDLGGQAILCDRLWTKTVSDSYHFRWKSDLDDVVDSFFERGAKLNGVELPVYGEDLDEILDENATFIAERHLLNS